MILGQIEHWQAQYSPAVRQDVGTLVKDAYEDVAVAKVSHMHVLTGTVFSEEQRDQMLMNPALSTSLLGLGSLRMRPRPDPTNEPAPTFSLRFAGRQTRRGRSGTTDAGAEASLG